MNYELKAELGMVRKDIFSCCFQGHVGGCQNYGPFLRTLNIRRRTIIGTQKGTVILTTTHVLYVV